MGINSRMLLVLALTGLLAGCGSKAKEAKETQEKLARWEKEHQNQITKQEKAPSSPTQAGQRAEGIVARVNNEVIFYSDLEFMGREIFERIRQQTPPERVERELQEARRALLERIIDRTLLEQEAERLKVKIMDEEVEASLQNMLKNRGATKEELYVDLARQKMSPERFREKLRRELMVARMLDLLVRAHIHVTDKECQEFYEANYKNLTPSAQPVGDAVRLQQIILLVKGSSEKEKEEKKKLLEEIRKRVLKGEDFGKLARQYTQGPNPEGGGDCGFFRPGDLLPELDRVAFSLKPGEVSQVVETHVGYHLLRVMGREEASSKLPDAVKAEIRAKLEEKQFQEEVRKLVESLRKNAFIDIRL
ncbi:MAG: peptidylprolyl isomerase [bacterium]